tara:strand:+ start:948 stop:1145 length:198 start_codon:yes stop_codon:yes gene_type:complete
MAYTVSAQAAHGTFYVESICCNGTMVSWTDDAAKAKQYDDEDYAILTAWTLRATGTANATVQIAA